jgi:hypothetical protein
MAAGAWDGDDGERVIGARKFRPQFADRSLLRGMAQLRRQVGERLQHESPAQQVRPR